ncbi:helix-turn-helix domain-containing protein [Candidatus Deianiraea vastatrix]|uniref:Phage-derived transcriptional regulator n=1 Tax=Candidatus Deianiraea vastatrix TaxID=2163644 RepID=A0A5B8XDN1_9RICK|nr:helix-turn-helix transcriptional regulator [Candidatus Deianiraea vastatrix]QED22985.1 Putative phage-derived transcriptional regulator [Candidatus Deianiraea vastatrix]
MNANTIKKKQLGNKIKEWRKQRNITQEDFAGKIERSTEAVSMIERGINFPSPDTVAKMSVVLGIPIHEFYKYGDEAKASAKTQKLIDEITGRLYKMDEKYLKIMLKVADGLIE